jgi:hypothetical protein
MININNINLQNVKEFYKHINISKTIIKIVYQNNDYMF